MYLVKDFNVEVFFFKVANVPIGSSGVYTWSTLFLSKLMTFLVAQVAGFDIL